MRRKFMGRTRRSIIALFTGHEWLYLIKYIGGLVAGGGKPDSAIVIRHAFFDHIELIHLFLTSAGKA
jgi:hypothetical protein